MHDLLLYQRYALNFVPFENALSDSCYVNVHLFVWKLMYLPIKKNDEVFNQFLDLMVLRHDLDKTTYA